MKNKIIGIFVCMLMTSCSTMTLALTQLSIDEKQMKNQFCDTTSAPLPLSKGWMKTFGGTHWDMGFSVQQTSDGGYIITGETFSFGAGGDVGDVWLIKTDSQGRPRTISLDNYWFERLFQRFLNAFPILQKLLNRLGQ